MNQVKTTLYALNRDGSVQRWKVFTEGEKVIVEFGKKDGKMQYKETICKAKNVGRANETTPEQQAVLEATSKWEKQVRLGYVEDESNLVVEENLIPMLVHDYLKRGKSLILPCWGSHKLDGLRLLVNFEGDTPVFISRGNKSYPIEGDIIKQLKQLRIRTGFSRFDGEIYIHGLPLQKIVSLAKRWRTQEEIQAEIDKDYAADIKRRQAAIKAGKPTYLNFNKEEFPVEVEPVRDDMRYGGYSSYDLQYHIFDIPSNKVWWDPETEQGRCADLLGIKDFIEDLDHIFTAEPELFHTVEECEESVGRYMAEGYEGTVLRNFCGEYEYGQRSCNALKWKKFNTDEAKVVGAEEDKNGEGVLICQLKNGKVFKCKMKGTHGERLYWRMANLKGKFITFKYQALTEDGLPSFPTGIAVRDVDPITWEVLE